MLWLLSGQLGFTCWISLTLLFSFIYCWVLNFALSPFISWFICFRRWCIDKLGVYHANQTAMCIDPHLNWGWGWRTVKPVQALEWNIFTDHSRAVLLLWIIYVISVLFLLCFCANLFIHALWSPAEKGLTSWLSFVMSNCEVVIFQYPGSGVVLDCIDSWSLPFFVPFYMHSFDSVPGERFCKYLAIVVWYCVLTACLRLLKYCFHMHCRIVA